MLIQSTQAVCGHRIVVQCLWVKRFGCQPVTDNRQHMAMLSQALQQVSIYSHLILVVSGIYLWHGISFLDESMPGTPTSPTGSHTSMALSVSSSNTVPIARGEKHVVLAMSPARPKVSSMQSKLDHTKIDTSLYDQVLFDSNEFNGINAMNSMQCVKKIKWLIFCENIGKTETESIDTREYTWRYKCDNQLRSECWYTDCSIGWSK